MFSRAQIADALLLNLRRILKGMVLIGLAYLPAVLLRASGTGQVAWVADLLAAAYLIFAPIVLLVLSIIAGACGFKEATSGVVIVVVACVAVVLADRARVSIAVWGLSADATIPEEARRLRTLFIDGDPQGAYTVGPLLHGQIDRVVVRSARSAAGAEPLLEATDLLRGEACATRTTPPRSDDRFGPPGTCLFTHAVDDPPTDGLVLRIERDDVTRRMEEPQVPNLPWTLKQVGCCRVLRGFKREAGVDAPLFTWRQGFAWVLTLPGYGLPGSGPIEAGVFRAAAFKPDVFSLRGIISYGATTTFDNAIRQIYGREWALQRSPTR